MKAKVLACVVSLFLCGAADAQWRVYEKVDYDGPVTTKTYKKIWIGNSEMTVPVINGVTPTVSEYFHNGAYYRTYTYPELTVAKKPETAPMPAETVVKPVPMPPVLAVAPMPQPKVYRRPAPSSNAKPIDK